MTPSVEDCPRAIAPIESLYLEGEAVLFDPTSRTVHQLGALAGAVWVLCDGATPVREMAEILGDLFGSEPGALTESIAEALTGLDAAGLLEGSERLEHHQIVPPVVTADDGTPVLAPQFLDNGAEAFSNAAGPETGTLLLRLRDVNLLVEVQVHGEALLERLTLLFERWLEPDARRLLPADPERFPAFTVAGPSSESAERGAPRRLGVLQYAGSTLARARSDDDIVRALASVIGGLREHRLDPERVWLGLRPFHSDGRVVLVDLARPLLVNDPSLAGRGIVELPTWSVELLDDGRVRVPGALPDLAWQAAGLDDAGDSGTVADLAGILAGGDPDAAGTVIHQLVRQSLDPGWFRCVAGVHEQGRFEITAKPQDARRIVALLVAGDERG